MKYLVSFLIFIFSTIKVLSQDFQVIFLIDQIYQKVALNTLLEPMNGLDLIGEDYIKFKMMTNSENEVKLPHKNDVDDEQDKKKIKKTDIIGMAGVRCDPCKRLEEERKSVNRTYILTSDNYFGTCSLKIDDYETLSSDSDLEEIIKKERKKAKKIENFKLIFWIPSNETVKYELAKDINDNIVDYGTVVNFTATTLSKENLPVIMKINDQLVDACNEFGVYKINRSTSLIVSHEITESVIVTLQGKGCENIDSISIQVDGNCDKIKKVELDLYYVSKSLRESLAKKIESNNSLDLIACSQIRLVDNKYYLFVLNKQCGVKEYRAEFEDVQTKKKFTAILRKSVEQAKVHLNSSDQDEYSVFTLNHDELKGKGMLDERSSDNSEPKYNMKIVPSEAVKSSLNLIGNASDEEVVKFQKCN